MYCFIYLPFVFIYFFNSNNNNNNNNIGNFQLLVQTKIVIAFKTFVIKYNSISSTKCLVIRLILF